MRRHRLTALTAVLAIGAGLLVGCTEDESEAACDAVSADFDWASPSRSDDARFELTGPGWIAGDSTYSVQLPDGRTLWLFSDSFIGEVDNSGEPAPGMAMVHNALLTEDATGQLTTHTSAGPESFFPDPGPKSYYWVQDATVVGKKELVVFLSRNRQDGGPGIEGFRWQRNAMATVSLPDLEVTGIHEFPSRSGAPPIAWGAGVMTTPTQTYVYGVEDRQQHKYLHLARVPAGKLTDRSAWRYRSGDGWSTDPGQSTRLTGTVANELSVSPYEDGYLMISSDTSEPFSDRINAWTSCSPWGPWRDEQTIYETPETGGEHFTYNAHGHPELSEDGELLISYNVNTFDFEELMGNPTLYRPKFIILDLE